MGFLSPEKLVLLALLLAIVFGTKGLPGIARRAGKGIRETRETLGIEAIRDEIGAVRSTFSEPSAVASTSGSGPADAPPSPASTPSDSPSSSNAA